MRAGLAMTRYTNPMKYTSGFMLGPPLAPGSARGCWRIFLGTPS